MNHLCKVDVHSHYKVTFTMNIISVHSHEILWCDKIKYLGIDLIASRVFNSSYDNAKRKFYRAFTSVQFLGKLGALPQKRL